MLCSGQRRQVMHGSTSLVALTPSLTEKLCNPLTHGTVAGDTVRTSSRPADERLRWERKSPGQCVAPVRRITARHGTGGRTHDNGPASSPWRTLCPERPAVAALDPSTQHKLIAGHLRLMARQGQRDGAAQDAASPAERPAVATPQPKWEQVPSRAR